MGAAKAIIDDVWEIIESQKLDRLDDVMATDVEFHMPGMDAKGLDQLKGMLGAYVEAFPDLHHEVLDYVESGDRIALELVVTGNHTGTMRTPNGDVAASGKRVVWESVDYIKLTQGKIASWHVYHDPTPFLTALGLAPGASA